MTNYKQLLVLICCIFVVVAGINIFLYLRNGPAVDSGNQLLFIEYMEANNIKIYGSYGCSWCVKQLEEFGEYRDLLVEKNLFIDCAEASNAQACADVTATPTWKKGNEIIRVGYLPFKELEANI